MTDRLAEFAYLVAAVLFILGIKGMSHPRTARRANRIAAAGMLVAIIATLVHQGIVDFRFIVAGLVAGTVTGLVMALRTPMTAMPQMVALLNGFGGAASFLVAGAAHLEIYGAGHKPGLQETIAASLSGFIGAVTFTGSLMAFGKLQGLVSDKARVPARMAVNVVLLAACAAAGAMFVARPEAVHYYWILVAIALVAGLTLVIGIGGADMPVAISLLNSYSGMAAAATGFVLNNTALIISGALVGASGIILTSIMCKAMNRSLLNVVAGGLAGAAAAGPSADEVYGGRVKSTSAEEIAMLADGAQKVVIVPGYGMAVAQAQHAVRDLARLLEERGSEVLFAIHPVAGRMPGHMNVLLAEADVSYDKLRTLDEANPLFPQTDLVFVIGANDVVNSDAINNPASPIAGMPILEVHHARTVIVIKRTLSPGYAGIPNPLFAADNCLLYFNDGKKAVLDIVNALKEG